MILPACLAVAATLAGGSRLARAADEQEHQHQHQQHMHMGTGDGAAATQDARQLVRFPEPLRSHTLQNMRDHLLTLGRIQDALAQGKFDDASELAETRLGMASLPLHGAHDVAPYMPEGMQQAGTAMHRSASRLALSIKDASVTGELKSTLAALGALNQTCVACHAAYRLR